MRTSGCGAVAPSSPAEGRLKITVGTLPREVVRFMRCSIKMLFLTLPEGVRLLSCSITLLYITLPPGE